MIDHLGFGVPDLAAAKSYYDQIMPFLGYEPWLDTELHFSYYRQDKKPSTSLFFYLADEGGDYSHRRTGLQHVAFKVKTRAEVDAACEKAVALGGEVVRPPAVYAQYYPDYYAAYWLDPHGFMLEAVCFAPE